MIGAPPPLWIGGGGWGDGGRNPLRAPLSTTKLAPTQTQPRFGTSLLAERELSCQRSQIGLDVLVGVERLAARLVISRLQGGVASRRLGNRHGEGSSHIAHIYLISSLTAYVAAFNQVL